MNKRNILIAIAAVVIVGVGAGALYEPAQKTVIHSDALLAQVTKDELLRESDAIVIGTVQNTQSFKAASEIRPGKEDILTNVSIAVSEYVYNPKNLSAAQITVQVLGGDVGEEKMIVEDGPSFEKDQRIIAFLKQKDESTFTVVGWAQGKYTVQNGGAIGIGEEKAHIKNIFGRDLTVEEFKREIAKPAVAQ